MNIVTGTYSNINEEPKGKVIRNITLARQILHKGLNDVRVIDVKPDRTDPDRKRSVIVFEDNDKFQDVLSFVMDENKLRRERRNNIKKDALQNEINDLKKRVEEFEKLTKNIDIKE